MKENIEALLLEINHFETDNNESLEAFRIKIGGKKGILSDLFEQFKQISPDQKREMGQKLNQVKQAFQAKLDAIKDQLSQKESDSNADFDFSRTPFPLNKGTRHPISIVRQEIFEIFKRIGYSIADGPEIEDDFHNFTALNFPEDHPARDMQDTFFIDGRPDTALRTHTSSIQIRVMESQKPPIRILAPGRVYRNEAVSARSHCFFHQIEGLYVDEGVSFADLKQTLLYFAKEFFGKSKIRLRPSYFPFTEPSAEMDVYWGLNSETDYRITKGTGWLEVLGCGMVDPNVLQNCGIDAEKYSGFAFGLGIERITMQRYQIPDLRYFSENDTRFLKQFASFI